MFAQHRSPSLVLCIGAGAALSWLAACASSDAPSGPSGAGGSSAGAATAAGAPSAGTSNSTAGATVTGGAGGTSSAGATAAGGGTAGGGLVGVAGTVSAGGAVGTAGAGGSGGTSLESPAGFFTAGYLTRTPWMGYVFTIVDSIGSVVSPVCDTVGCTPAWGTQACAKGTVIKSATSGGFAGLAFHANDPVGGPRGTWTSTGAGVYVSVSNPPALARLQLQEEVASDDTRYCATLPAGGTGLIPFSDFKTYCWGDVAHPSKAFAIGTAVSEVTVNIPGNQTADVPFDFCLIDIQPR